MNVLDSIAAALRGGSNRPAANEPPISSEAECPPRSVADPDDGGGRR